MLPGDRLICAFIEKQETGATLRHWPLHVTIVPWFRLDESSEVLAQGFQRALTDIEPFEATMGGTAFFGVKRDRPVRLIRQPTPFVQVEAKVRAYLHKKRALLIDETTKQSYEFRPHVTNQGMSGLRDSDSFWCGHVLLLQQEGDHKSILNKIPLGVRTK